jgi:hypothetical protein
VLKRSRHATLYCLCLALFAATPVLARPIEAQTVTAGTRVRVTTDRLGRISVQGVITSSTPDSLLLLIAPGARGRVGRDTITLARAEINKLETHAGRRRNPAGDTAAGVVAGALVGAMVGFTSYSPCTETGLFGCAFSPGSSGEAAVWGMIGGGVVGAAAGLIMSAFHVSDVWAQSDPQIRFGYSPRGAGIGMSLSIR